MGKVRFEIEYLSGEESLTREELIEALTSCDKCSCYDKSELIIKEVE